jgi:WD40 repeat protein
MNDKNPFPGAQPYRSEDRERFYGRGPLVKKLVNQVLACASTTVFGPSGAGKSSLMQAGVIPALQKFRDIRIVRVDAWPTKEPLLPWLVNEIFTDFDLGPAPKEKPALEALEEAIDLAARRSDRLMLFYLDQIEQIFLSERSAEELETFLRGLTWLIDEAPGDVHLVLSLREDYLGRLRDFTRERPELSANGFRVAPLSVKDMVKAMCQTASEGDPPQIWEAPEIRKLMLDVRVPGQIPSDEAEVQTAFGQIVCRALFEQRAAGQASIEFGANAEAILQRYLDTTLAGMGTLQELARTLLEVHLIDDEGHRRLLTEKEARLLVRSDDVVDVLDKLDTARVLRAEEHQGSRYFEIGHDWLAKKLLEKRLERKELARQAKEKRRRRTLMTIVTLAIGTLLVVSVLAVVAWDRMNEAQRVQRELKLQTDVANLAKEDAVRASQMAGVRELLASGKPSIAAMVLAEVDKPDKARGWRQITIDLLAKDLPWRTVRFERDVHVIAWSPDGLRVATASNDDIVRVSNAKSIAESVLLKPHYGKVRAIAWSPDGQRIATTSDDQVVRLWNADGIGEPVLLTGHTGQLFDVAWSPGGERIVTTSSDKTARVWNANGSGQSLVLEGHEGWVLSAAWSPDGKRIITASQDNTARIWNADGGGKSIVVQGHDQLVNSAAWSPDGTRFVTTSNKTARVWNINEMTKGADFTEHEDNVLFAAWSPDGRRIVTTSGDHTARVWNADGLGVSRILAGHEGPVVSARWSKDGKRIFTTSLDNTAREWNIDHVGGRIRFDAHSGFIVSAAWSPDGKRFATASIDNTIRLWNADGSGDGVVFKKQEHKAFSVAWSPDGRRIATTSSNTARVWNADGSGESIVFAGHEGDVYSVAWSPDGKRLATASVDKTARVWNADGTGESIVFKGHEGYVASVRWSPDGKRIATASDDKTARIWNADGSGESVIFKGHEQTISSVAWSPAGKHIVTASGDATARIWSVDGAGERYRSARSCRPSPKRFLQSQW